MTIKLQRGRPRCGLQGRQMTGSRARLIVTVNGPWRLYQHQPPTGMQMLGMLTLAVASLLTVLLSIATWKGWREGSLLQPEPVAIVAVPGAATPPGPQ